MNRYTFKFAIAPSVAAGYEITLPPFHVKVQEAKLTLQASADAGEEQLLREHAIQAANNLIRSMSYELGMRFRAEYQGRDVRHDTGQQTVGFHLRITVKPAANEAPDPAALEREQRHAQERIIDLAKREALDANLQDMLEHWRKYKGDPDGRLHPLYDMLQVAERLYGSRRNVASALNLSDADLSDLGRISNDPMVLNGRHPGRSAGPHRIATKTEVSTCERVARALIENQAAKVTV
jgi:hypothetical protein